MGVVVCQNCGAKVRAGRTRCPRCRATLTGATAAPRVDFNKAAPAALALLIVTALVTAYALWRYSEETAEPAVQAATAVRPAPAPALPARVPAPPPAPREPGPSGIPFIEPDRAGGVAYGGGEYDRALALYQDAVKRNPNDAESWSNMGQVLVRLNRPEEAIPAYLKAIELNGGRWAYHFNLGRAYGLTSQWADAVAAYRRAQQLYPEDYAIAFNLGLALRKNGELEPAIEQFAKAIALDPSDATFTLALAMSYDQLNRKADALAAYQKTLELAPDAPEVAQIRARIDALLH